MRTVFLVNTPSGQVVPLPHDMSYEGINELEIHREGDVITLWPVTKKRRNIADSLAMPDWSDIDLEPPRVEVTNKLADFTLLVTK
ncbi:AbrB family transcriptional regulator [Halomonas stenophila]|uniref:Virulence-associated protein VagC n=1 Tax=Halomonas stenophila TaxID=795312 RepID=A0A7W5EVS5_9GAMM|nr:AbrB family transcriptional regulator [Halomonas stenophila]MBB3231937.1 virulence-associated protein VagC [Halomonas stenophila]